MLNRGIVMEKTLRQNMLFDFYCQLLTKRQQEIYQMYFTQDLSLGEIAEHLDISRQAVYDNLRRASASMEELESKLGLMTKYLQQQKSYERILEELSQLKAMFQDINGSALHAKLNLIRGLIEKIKSEG